MLTKPRKQPRSRHFRIEEITAFVYSLNTLLWRCMKVKTSDEIYTVTVLYAPNQYALSKSLISVASLVVTISRPNISQDTQSDTKGV